MRISGDEVREREAAEAAALADAEAAELSLLGDTDTSDDTAGGTESGDA